MRIAQGNFNGVGSAAIYICCGFVPDWVRVWNLEDGDLARVEWNVNMMRAAETCRGIHLVGSSGATQEDARTCSDGGILPYYGGDLVASGNTTYLGPIADEYKNLCKNPSDSTQLITSWTLDTAANHTGHFNAEANTTYVGEGSLVIIGGKRYSITAMSSNGDQTDETTLSDAAPTGIVGLIGPMYDYVAYAAGKTTAAGFMIEWTDVVNVSGEICCFEAGTY